MSETVWTVDRYVDRLKERDARRPTKEQAIRLRIGGGSEHLCDHLFQSRDEAVSFMLQRAQKQLHGACQNVKKIQARVIKLRKKYL